MNRLGCCFWSWHLECTLLPEVWTKAAELASAYDIGRAESQAAINLLNETDAAVVQRLSDLVRPGSCPCQSHGVAFTLARFHGMTKFLTHEAIASGMFGRSYSAADGLPSGSVWRETLANRGPVLEWLLMRMDSDYKGTHVRLRKCWKTADLALCLQVKVGATCQF